MVNVTIYGAYIPYMDPMGMVSYGEIHRFLGGTTPGSGHPQISRGRRSGSHQLYCGHCLVGAWAPVRLRCRKTSDSTNGETRFSGDWYPLVMSNIAIENGH